MQQPGAFDVIPFEDIKGDWQKLGSGSFGNVYKGTYLGIDVAIKEVLPSAEYDVAKYFEREWRLMKEARHPNVVLYLGLSRAPDPDNRIFIISEYIENGNLRGHILDKAKPFPWHLRLSFATDIARALAYLHARNCIHRDLKGENLLVTSNGRLKVTDFGFARIAARNEDESKRLTFCGTDSYMSPEILVGEEFDLKTDIFSLGIIFCEISSRTIADENRFKRTAPSFSIDETEVHRLASSGCPPAFLALCLDCLADDPNARPNTRVILERLREIEAEVLARPSEDSDMHVGSIRFMSTAKKQGPTPRIPSFGVGVGKDIRGNTVESSSAEDSDEEPDIDLESIKVEISKMTGRESREQRRKSDDDTSAWFEYSTSVVRSHSPQTAAPIPPSLSSILTIRPSPNIRDTPQSVLPNTLANLLSDSTFTSKSYNTARAPHTNSSIRVPETTDSILLIDTFHTAQSSSIISTAAATEGGSTIRTLPMVHRFTLIKPGAKRSIGDRSGSPPGMKHIYGRGSDHSSSTESQSGGWNPLDLFFSSGLLVSKCDICTKRLGWKPVLECDDCGLRAHTKCGEVAPRDCGIRPVRPGVHQALNSVSPLSKVIQNARLS